jgi:cysteinyl-tRNA synthetase, unknown class
MKMTQQASWSLVWLVITALFAIAWPYRHAPAHRVAVLKADRPLAAVRSWHYQLDKIDVAKLAEVAADLLVIDYAKYEGKNPLTRDEVSVLQTGPDGRRRYVVAYLSVGESEEFRFYWKDAWKKSPPDWLGEENCAWPKARRVRYWQPGWKDINFRNPDSYLSRIVDAGFDGVYLDRVDIYETFEKERPTARDEMIAHVSELAHAAWRLKPGFFIIPQNAESLLAFDNYRSAIDGLGKESLLHGGHATAKRNTHAEIRGSLNLLKRLLNDGKPVFGVEYLLEPGHIHDTAMELGRLNIVGTFETRALDGGDPTVPVDLKSEIGTPERTQKDCPPGTSW